MAFFNSFKVITLLFQHWSKLAGKKCIANNVILLITEFEAYK